MTKILSANIQIELLMSDDGKERFILKKVWDENKPMVTILHYTQAQASLL